MNVNVAENTYGLIQSLAQFISTVKGCLEDGWQPGQDMPEILASAVSNLVPMFARIGSISAEVASDRLGAERAVAVGVVDLINSLIAKG